VRRADPERLYYALAVLLAMPTWVAMAVYLVQVVDMSPLQLVLMGTAMEAAIFVSEVPTGVVADTYSRRLSVIIGWLGMGAAWMAVGAVSSPSLVIAVWAFWGFAYTFTSGAYQAGITDEVGVENAPRDVLRGSRIGYVGAVAGLIGQVALATVSLRAAVIAGGAVTALCGLIAIALMPETGFTRRPREERGSPLAELRTTAGAGARYARAAPVIVLLVAVAVFMGASSEAFDRLKEAHFLRDVGLPWAGHGSPVVFFGALWLIALAMGFVGTTLLIRRVERRGRGVVSTSLVVCAGLELVAMLVFAFAWSPWVAVAGILAVFLARDLADPLYTTWLNDQITDSRVRATVFSIGGQGNAIGQAAGGPVIGAIGNVWGIRAALTAGAVAIVPALGLYGRASAHHGAEPELEELPQPATG
jgi:DHA3 family tetracycline resistance protein-like MFS transporter